MCRFVIIQFRRNDYNFSIPWRNSDYKTIPIMKLEYTSTTLSFSKFRISSFRAPKHNTRLQIRRFTCELNYALCTVDTYRVVLISHNHNKFRVLKTFRIIWRAEIRIFSKLDTLRILRIGLSRWLMILDFGVINRARGKVLSDGFAEIWIL